MYARTDARLRGATREGEETEVELARSRALQGERIPQRYVNRETLDVLEEALLAAEGLGMNRVTHYLPRPDVCPDQEAEAVDGVYSSSLVKVVISEIVSRAQCSLREVAERSLGRLVTLLPSYADPPTATVVHLERKRRPLAEDGTVRYAYARGGASTGVFVFVGDEEYPFRNPMPPSRWTFEVPVNGGSIVVAGVATTGARDFLGGRTTVPIAWRAGGATIRGPVRSSVYGRLLRDWRTLAPASLLSALGQSTVNP